MVDRRDPTDTIAAGGAAGEAAPRITGPAGESTDLPPTPPHPKRRGARIFRVCTGCHLVFASYELDRQIDGPGGRCRACGHGGPWHRQFPVVASFQQCVRVLRACLAYRALLSAYRFRRRDGQSTCPRCAQHGARVAFPIVWDVFVHEGLRETRPALMPTRMRIGVSVAAKCSVMARCIATAASSAPEGEANDAMKPSGDRFADPSPFAAPTDY